MTTEPMWGHESDWALCEGVVEVAFSYGADRHTTGLADPSLVEPKARFGNPTQNQIAVASASFGFSPTDAICTIWAETLPDIVPLEGDKITDADGTVWIIKWVKKTLYKTQYLCYCAMSSSSNPNV